MTTKELYEQYKQILPEEDYLRLREEYDHKWQLFDKICLKLIPEGFSESRLNMVLERLDEIQPQRSEADRATLRNEVIDVCFIFFCERRKSGQDFSRRGREKNRSYEKVLKKLAVEFPHVSGR